LAAATSLVLIALALYWFLRLRERFGRHPFIVFSSALIVIVSLAGALSHAWPGNADDPVWRLVYFLDWAPAFILAIAAAACLWSRAFGTVEAGILAALMPNLVAIAVAGSLPHRFRMHVAALFLAGNVFLAAISDLRRRDWRHGLFVMGAMFCLLVGVALRAVHPLVATVFRPGTHFIWHLFGGGTAHLMLLYIFHSREDQLRLAKSSG